MQLIYLSAAVFAGQALAGPKPKIAPRQAPASPCAAVSASASAALAAGTAVPVISAELGYDCLNSVSLHAPQALDLVNSILPFVEWQSTTAYLKDPPAGYQEPAVDIFAGFDAVLVNISNGVYTNEYDFQSHLWPVFNTVHDGHFRFLPDLLSKAITFRRPYGVVSVSIDGVAPPKVYAYPDVIADFNTSTTPSAISTIDGQDVYTFLEGLGQLGALQDRDASYNTLFYSPAFNALSPGWLGYFGGSGRYGYIYPGATTSITFENGTTVTLSNLARVIGDFTGVTDGDSFYQKFCTGPAATPPSNATTTTTSATPTGTVYSSPTAEAPAGYPTPIVISPDQSAAGYYLDSYPDVAVLSMLSFEPDVPLDFQIAVQTFLADAKAAGKTKLIVDIFANGGGYILQGYDTFRQLFPQIEQDGFTRFRDAEGIVLIAEQFAELIPANYSPATASAEIINDFESFENYRFDYNVSDVPFSSVEDKFGPHEYYGDNFTSIIRWDLNDPILTINATFGMGEEITGYGTRTNFTQPFAAEDIIMIYDGYCASTCTLFSEFMRIQGGVKSIAFGGRTTTSANGTVPIIQAIGGTKGANNFGYDYINYLAGEAYNSGTPEQQASAPFQDILLPLTSTLALNRSTDTSINARDNILRDQLNAPDQIPAQFLYEAADCRIFYTPAMTTGPTAIWEAAAEAAFGTNGACVAGSLPGGSTAPAVKRSKTSSQMLNRSPPKMIRSGVKPLDEKARMNLGRPVPH